jgi:hypothetical protein
MHILKSALAALLVVLTLSVCHAQPGIPRQAEIALPIQQGDYIAHNFKFGSGETLPEPRLHYRSLGSPKRDAEGHVPVMAISFINPPELNIMPEAIQKVPRGKFVRLPITEDAWGRNAYIACHLACSRNRNQMQNDTAYNFSARARF